MESLTVPKAYQPINPNTPGGRGFVFTRIGIWSSPYHGRRKIIGYFLLPSEKVRPEIDQT